MAACTWGGTGGLACNTGALGNTTLNGNQVTYGSAVYSPLTVSGAMDEPTQCGRQGTPVVCGDNQDDVITGANARPTQVVIQYPPANLNDFFAIGVVMGCVRNADTVGGDGNQCTGINASNGGVYKEVYYDSYYNGYYFASLLSNWKVSAGQVVNLEVAPNTADGCRYSRYINGSVVADQCPSSGSDLYGRVLVGSENAGTGGDPKLTMDQYSWGPGMEWFNAQTSTLSWWYGELPSDDAGCNIAPYNMGGSSDQVQESGLC
jgi:hypothetical protein